jgi:hypothetical protein
VRMGKANDHELSLDERLREAILNPLNAVSQAKKSRHLARAIPYEIGPIAPIRVTTRGRVAALELLAGSPSRSGTRRYSKQDETLFERPSFDTPGREPEHPRCRDRINSLFPPPSDFIFESMVVPVMRSTKRDGELIADLSPHRQGLGEPQMVAVSGASAAFAYHSRLHSLQCCNSAPRG